MNDLVLDFGLVMVLLLIAPLVSTRLRLPGIVGLILAGILAGEHGLGWFRLDVTFELLGKIGLLYLMFLAGLEINLNEFRRYRKPSLVFGAVTFLIPQVVGTLGARWLLHFSWTQAILLASMFASHTLIPFPIVHRLGLGRNRAVTTTIGGTILTDTAALLVLAVIVRGGFGQGDAAAAGVGFWFWGRLVLSLALLLVGSLALLPRLGYWFFRRSAPDGSADFVFVLAAVFMTAYASEAAGVEPIIGAFLAGLGLSSLLPERGVLTSRVHFVGHALFIPFFLLSVGMRVNLGVLIGSLDSWTVALYMAVCVTATKWLAAEISGRWLGYDRVETNLVFGLSVNQAAATLAAVLVGVRVGIFGEDVLNGTILMILVTCLIGPYVTERSGHRLAEQSEDQPRVRSRATGRVLVTLSSPVQAEALMDLALMIRPDRSDEPVYPLRIVLDGPDVAKRITEAERLLGGAVGRAVAADTPVIPLARIDLNVAGGILRAAIEFHVSAIVMGWQPSLHQLNLTQSIPERVTRHAMSAMLLFRPGAPLNTIRRLWVVLPPLIERHSGFAAALKLAQHIASQAGTRARFVANPASLHAVQKLPGLGANAATVDWEPVASWGDAIAVVESRLEPVDGIVVFASRPGELAWQPSLERLPVQWARRFPDANLMLIYPPQADLAGDSEGAVAALGEPAPIEPSLEPVFVTIAAESVSDAVRLMLQAVLPACPAEIDALAEHVRDVGPVPLSRRATLVHAHTGLVDRARLVVGTRRDGFHIDGVEGRPVHLMLLISPLHGGTEQHLQALAAIARGVRDGTILLSERPASSPPGARMEVPA